MDWVLIIFGTQVIKKKRPVRPVFPGYLSVSYDYGLTKAIHRVDRKIWLLLSSFPAKCETVFVIRQENAFS